MALQSDQDFLCHRETQQEKETQSKEKVVETLEEQLFEARTPQNPFI